MGLNKMGKMYKISPFADVKQMFKIAIACVAYVHYTALSNTDILYIKRHILGQIAKGSYCLNFKGFRQKLSFDCFTQKMTKEMQMLYSFHCEYLPVTDRARFNGQGPY